MRKSRFGQNRVCSNIAPAGWVRTNSQAATWKKQLQYTPGYPKITMNPNQRGDARAVGLHSGLLRVNACSEESDKGKGADKWKEGEIDNEKGKTHKTWGSWERNEKYDMHEMSDEQSVTKLTCPKTRALTRTFSREVDTNKVVSFWFLMHKWFIKAYILICYRIKISEFQYDLFLKIWRPEQCQMTSFVLKIDFLEK